MKKSKASSSSAAAALAANHGFGGGGFGGGFGSAFGSSFGGGFGSSIPAASASSSSSTDEPEVDAWTQLMAARAKESHDVSNPQLVLAFKQLTKRDPVTRLKSLETITSVFTGMTHEEAVAVLPAWVGVFERLYLDNDRRVREQIYSAFAPLRETAAKQFAPYLKSVFPLWYLHMKDPCREVARAAANMFQAAFPTPAKRTQVLFYCHKEYFGYCQSLFNHTAVTLSDQTMYSLEESVERFERATASALASLAEFVETTCTPTEDAATPSPATSVSLDAYNKLLTSGVLSKFVKSKTVLIRRTLYVLLKALVVHDPASFVSSNLSLFAPIILVDLLDEADRSNHAILVDTYLTFLKKFHTPAWEALQSANKFPEFINQFYTKLVRSGLGGHYTATYPAILPILSFLPDSTLTDVFLREFLEKLWAARKELRDAGGLPVSLHSNSSKEFQALQETYFECLVYILKKKVNTNPALQRSLAQKYLVSSVLGPALSFANSAITPENDPSVTQEAINYHRFGASFFERAGKALREATALLQSSEDLQAVWETVLKSCLDAMENHHHDDALKKPAPAATTADNATPKRNNVRAAESTPSVALDQYVAVTLVFAQQDRASDSKPASPQVLTSAASVFRTAFAQFSEHTFARLSALKLCVQLGDIYSLVSLLSSAPNSTTLSAFLSNSLLPVLRNLLTAASNAQEGAAATHVLYVETVEVFAKGLLSKALDELGLSTSAKPSTADSSSSSSSSANLHASVWTELLQLLSSSSLSASSSIASSKLYLGLLRILFEHIFAKCASVHGHADLQELIVTQAEAFLTCERSELLHEYLNIFRAILMTPGLLAKDVQWTLLSSFYDAVESFQKFEGDFSALSGHALTNSKSKEFITRFENETGANIHVVPALIKIVGSLLGTEVSLSALAPSAADGDRFRITLVQCLFWLQHSPREEIAEQARAVWTLQVDKKFLKETPQVLLDLAAVFRERVLRLPLASLTSQFIMSWGSWLTQLFSTLDHPYIQQKILDTALPSHADFKQLIASAGLVSLNAAGMQAIMSLSEVAERLRVIRDLVSELQFAPASSGLSERVLFLGEASSASTAAASSGSSLQWEGQPRLGLLVDLLATQEWLKGFEREADASVLRDQPAANDLVQWQQVARKNGDANLLEDNEAHIAIFDKLSFYLQSKLLTGSHIQAMVKTALNESLAASKTKDAESSPAVTARAIASARAYNAALKALLSFSKTHRVQTVTTFLDNYLANVPVDQFRSHTNSSLYEPFENTVVTLLESGCVTVQKSGVLEASMVNLIKWTGDGFEAGMRMLNKQNEHLFELCSMVRLQAALLRVFTPLYDSASPLVESHLSPFRSKVLRSTCAALNLFEPLQAGAAGFSTQANRFFEARAELTQALLTSPGAGLESAWVQTSILWATSVLKYAGNQHAAALKAGKEAAKRSAAAATAVAASATSADLLIPTQPLVSANWFFTYLSSSINFMSSAADILLPSTPNDFSSQPTLSAALHAFMAMLYPLFVAASNPSAPAFQGILSAVSVKSFTKASLQLEHIVRLYRQQRTAKFIELVREDFRLAKSPASSSSSGGLESDSSNVEALFRLLAHSLPSIALSALHFLSIGLLDRAICVPINFELNAEEEMAHVLESSAAFLKQQQKAKSRAGAAELTEEQLEQEEIELEHHRKSLKNDYQRKITQQRLVELLPHTLRRILEERIKVNEIDVLESEEEEVESQHVDLILKRHLPFFSFRSIAMQIRGQMLTWSLVLDLLSQSLPAPDEVSSNKKKDDETVRVQLSDEKSTLLLGYLRDSDAITPFMSEFIEHMLVSYDESIIEKFIMRTVRKIEHNPELEEQKNERKSGEKVVAEPAVIIEDEDEDGNLIPAKPASSASSASEATPTAVVIKNVSEYPLWRNSLFLLSNESLPDVKVLPFCMKRLLRIRKALDDQESASNALQHNVDTRIYFGAFSCLLYLRTLRVLPALSRSWFTHIDRSNGSVISKLTSTAFSPLLIQDELLDVMHQQSIHNPNALEPEDEDDQFVIKTNYSADGNYRAKQLAITPAVVFAKFVKGEISMGLSIKLPSNYPLLPVSVSLNEQVKLKEEKSKKWCLAITSILGSSDGSMYSAIQVWKKNLDAHFAGVSECTICYSVISSVNHSLPRMKCHECSNLFHSHCLYKWFQSSGNSQCPLCRTNWHV